MGWGGEGNVCKKSIITVQINSVILQIGFRDIAAVARFVIRPLHDGASLLVSTPSPVVALWTCLVVVDNSFWWSVNGSSDALCRCVLHWFALSGWRQKHIY